jgi:8-oxo-dGTP pyrophosphatase MutT (NUDIX family)
MSKDTITVALIVESGPEEKVLLLQRNPYPGGNYVDPFGEKWELIGGHIEPGEEPIKAALREIMEEIGILVMRSFLELVEVVPFNTATNYIYACRIPVLPPVLLSHEHIAFSFVTLRDAMQSQLAFKHNDALNAIVSKKQDAAPMVKPTRRKCRVQIQERNRYASMFNTTVQYDSDNLPEWFKGLQSIVEDLDFRKLTIKIGSDVRYHISIAEEPVEEPPEDLVVEAMNRIESPDYNELG